MDKKVSIIIPIYNAEKYLENCLSSVISQAYKNLEIVLVNDGSKDNSREIIAAFADRDARIKIVDKPNGGVSSARNMGLDNITGEFVAFLDADDWIEKDYISTLVNNMIEANADISICNYKWEKLNKKHFKNKKIKTILFNSNFEIVNEIALANNIFGSLWCKLLKRDLIGDLRFSKTIHYGEDAMFLYEYIKRCTCGVYTSAKLYHYIKVKSSLSAGKINAKKTTLFDAISYINNNAKTTLPASADYINLWLYLVSIELYFRMKFSKYNDEILRKRIVEAIKSTYPYFKKHKKELKTFRKFAGLAYPFVNKKTS